MKTSIAALLIVLGLAGCSSVSSRLPEVSRVPHFVPVAGVHPTVQVPRDVAFAVSLDSLEQGSYVLPSGEYRLFGRDELGSYYLHDGPGIRASDGRAYLGGFFVPKDPAKQLMAWWEPGQHQLDQADHGSAPLSERTATEPSRPYGLTNWQKPVAVLVGQIPNEPSETIRAVLPAENKGA
jgi:hypothetical protein